MGVSATGLTQAVLSGVLVGGVYGLVAIGFSLAFGVMRIVNFAHGSLVMLGMYATLELSAVTGLDPFLFVPLNAILIGALGVALYAGVFRRFVGRTTLQQLLAAIAITLVIEAIAQMAFGPETRAVASAFGSRYLIVGPLFFSFGQIAAFAIAIACVAVLEIGLRVTRWGTLVRAIADDAEIARLVGIGVHRVNIAAFAVACGLAGIAGGVLVSYYPVSPVSGFNLMPIALIATVIGGLGSITGAMIGGLLCAIVEQVTSAAWSAALADVPLYILLLVFLAFWPGGLLGRSAAA
ncbi:MAG: branched-chain amino acid ABC transporter permease [Acetobacteraceae bacterium]|nr:branched-chain amino acid ABC transporter permease [Acetobacteraceae bacterium]